MQPCAQIDDSAFGLLLKLPQSNKQTLVAVGWQPSGSSDSALLAAAAVVTPVVVDGVPSFRNTALPPPQTQHAIPACTFVSGSA